MIVHNLQQHTEAISFIMSKVETQKIGIHLQIQGVLCLLCFLRFWKKDRVSRKQCKQRSDLVLNEQMREPE